MITHEILEEIIIFIEKHIVKSDSRAYKDFLYSFYFAQTAEKMQIFAFVHHKVFTGRGRKTLFTFAHTVLFLSVA